MKLVINSPRICIVSESSTLDAHKKMLDYLGFQVVEISSSTKALDLIKVDLGQFDLIMVDMEMSQMSGYKLAARIQALFPDIPIILYNASCNEINAIQAKGMGARELTIRPLTSRNLYQMIQTILREDTYLKPRQAYEKRIHINNSIGGAENEKTNY